MTDRPVNRFFHVTFKQPYPCVMIDGWSTPVAAATCEADDKIGLFAGVWPLQTRTLWVDGGARVIRKRTLLAVNGNHVVALTECDDQEAEIPVR